MAKPSPLYPILAALAGAALLAACGDSDSDASPAAEPSLRAEIRRTAYGIPHIKADDWAGLGYGYGYAYSQDNYCVTMREVIYAAGQSAERFGERGGNADSDFLTRYINGSKEEFARQFFDRLPDYAQELSRGAAAGMNRYLEETGAGNLPEGEQGCRDASWVRPVDEIDLLLYQSREALRGSSNQGVFRRAILATSGPSAQRAASARTADPRETRAALQALARELRQPGRGSNAIALGREATQTGAGMLLGNPHQPWRGAGSWYQAHLTIPGVLDVAGATLTGYPFIGIGFNKDVAWTHTVSLANRFSLYELELNPDNPLQYDYEGQWRDIVPETIEIRALLADGTLETRSHTFYTSHYGPVVDLGGISPLLGGWPLSTGSVLAFRDANLGTGPRAMELWLTKAQAGSLDEYIDALSIIGNPVFHDLAADRDGNAFYGEISTIPHVTAEQLEDCVGGLIGPLLASATTNVIITLDGSRAACEWGEDPQAPPGSNVYSAGRLPQLRTANYVANSNNSYWLSDADNPIEGFPVIMGPVGGEGMQQFLRTRIGHIMVAERMAGTDGFDDAPKFTLDSLKRLMYSNRVYGAEIALDDVLSICAGIPAPDPAAGAADPDAAALAGCRALRAWDRKVELDSRGAQVFTEFWRELRDARASAYQNVIDSDEFWRVDFDPEDPIRTPRGIDTGVQGNRELVVEALAAAVLRLRDNDVALDARWGEVQYLERNQERVPIHGGWGPMGVYGAISAGLGEGGYVNPGSGNSYIQAVTWDESQCPIADVILTTSNSSDPDSPHFSDQSKLYSNKQWVRFPFCEEQIVAGQVGETLAIEE